MKVKIHKLIILVLITLTGFNTLAQERIKVMSFNILEGGVNGLDTVFDVITDFDPDIVLVQEINTLNIDFADAATVAGYNYVINDLGYNSVFGGPALISKYPVLQEEIYYRIAYAKLDLGSGVFLMANSVHLPPNNLHEWRVYTAKQMAHEYLRNEIEEFPVIFGGDLNVSTGSFILEEFTNLGFTQDVYDSVDHIYSHGLEAVPGTGQTIGPNIYGSAWPSDHNAVYVEYYKPVVPIIQESSSATIQNQFLQSHNFSTSEIQALVQMSDFSSVEIVSLPTRGNLLFNAIPVTAGDFIPVSEFGNLSYNNQNVGRDEIEWRAYDNINNPARTSSYFYIENEGHIKDLDHRKIYQNIEILSNGVDLFYGDGDYFVSTSEPDLLGSEFIKFPTYFVGLNLPLNIPSLDDYFSMYLNNGGKLYIAYDDRFIGIPSWITNNFILTNISFSSNLHNFKVYKKTVDSGPFTFGGNDGLAWEYRLVVDPFIMIAVPGQTQTNIPDDNFEQALIDLGHDTGPLDDYVSTTNIELIPYLDVSGYNISNLTGIEDFTSLSQLLCGNNQLTSLDVTQNTALTELDCATNQLTNLNVTNNIALGYLNCYNNQLINLDVSQNMGLDVLICGANQLTSIDVSSNTALTQLRCQSNQITSLDISNNTILTHLWCYDNQLTSLDVSINTSLIELNIFSNLFTSLNIKNGKNNAIAIFDATSNPNLFCIEVDNVAYSTSNWIDIDSQTSFSDTDCYSRVLSKVFLQGPYNTNTGLMTDELRSSGLIPLTSPYADGITVDQAVLDVTGVDAIIDWIWIELRDSTDGTTVVASTSALLQSDGDIVDTDGVSQLVIDIPVGNYYLMISHRNHLGVLTAVTVTLTDLIMNIDLTGNSTLVEGGTNGIKDMGNGSFAIFAGDFNGDGQVQNTDKNAVEPLRGISGYENADIDLNGEVQNTDINSMLNPNLGKGEQFARRNLMLYAKRSTAKKN